MQKALVILIALVLAGFVGYYVYTALNVVVPVVETETNRSPTGEIRSSSPLLKTNETGSLILN